MAEQDKPNAELEAITKALSVWRQGDCVIGEQWFSYKHSCTYPVTDAAKIAAAEQIEITETPERGLVVVSQTCDLVRDISERPFVDVCPLVEIEDLNQMTNIRKGRSPRYAYIPGAATQNLVGDLDRTMTVEKPVVAQWTRTQGCSSEDETRFLAWSLARQRSRFAFPDDFTGLLEPLRSRFTEKHSRSSPEGDALRALKEVRVSASPNWDAATVDVHFWFFREDNTTFGNKKWDEHLKSWEPLLAFSGRFRYSGAIVTTYSNLSAQEYLSSVQLDLENLSMTPKKH